MSSPATIDNQTADIVRLAMTEARVGRSAQACEIVERGLAAGGDAFVLNAMLGALRCGVGEFGAAIDPLSMALERRPDDRNVRANLVIALLHNERFADVVSALPDDVIASDPSMNFLRQRAYAAHMGGQLDLALSDYRRFLDSNKDDWESWNNLGNAYRNAGDLTSAIEALRNAALINPKSAPTRLNLARALRDFGDFVGAEAELRSMARDFPSDEKPLLDLFGVLHALGRSDEELEAALRDALTRDPANVEALIELGDHQLRLLSYEKAEKAYREALALSPANAFAYLGLARVYEHLKPGELSVLVADAEAAGIADDAHLNLIRAFGARRAKAYVDGLEALDRVPLDVEPAIRWHLAGQLLESLERYDEAFAAFSALNAVHAADPSDPIGRAAELRKTLRRQLEQTTNEWRQGWATAPVNPARPSPVFLVGFPRSGTTLLDTIFMGHPKVAVMEERPILHTLGLGPLGFDSVPALDAKDIRGLQERYFELSSEYVALAPDTVLIDKSPLHLHRVPQILRLFPDARFIFSVRHPADVVLSCFKANFRLNNAMSNFLALDTAVEFYDLTFQLWDRACAVFAPEVHAVRYESLIEDPEAEVRPVVEALGLDWSPAILDHQKTARDRGAVSTASYAQVTEPLYRHADGRWRHYRAHLEPFLTRLEPWIAKFGYSH